MKQLGVAIIGAGAIGARLSQHFVDHDRFDVRWICDLEGSRAEKLAMERQSKATTNLDEVLADPEISLVYIGIPPKYHKEVTLKAFQAGKHVFCEKPIAHTVEDGQAMIDAAQSSGLLGVINLNVQFLDIIQKATQMLRDGEIGKVRKVYMWYRYPRWPRQWQDVDWVNTQEQGGPLREVGTHLMHTLMQMTDTLGKPMRVMSVTSYPDDVISEEALSGIVMTDKNIQIQVDVAVGVVEDQVQAYEILGETGTITFKDFADLLIRKEFHREEILSVSWPETQVDFSSRIADAITDPSKRDGLISFQAAHETNKIIDALLNSNNQWIEL